MTNQKFSTASDVWSFGITCVEIFSDGSVPYPAIASNPECMKHVASGGVHPRPANCSVDVYHELQRCWSFDPASRPEFATLVEFFGATTERVTERQSHCAAGGGVSPTPSPALTYDLGSDADRLPGAYDLGSRGSMEQAYDLGYGQQDAGEQYDLGHHELNGNLAMVPLLHAGAPESRSIKMAGSWVVPSEPTDNSSIQSGTQTAALGSSASGAGNTPLPPVIMSPPTTFAARTLGKPSPRAKAYLRGGPSAANADFAVGLLQEDATDTDSTRL